jgi:predicted DNA binding protein
MVLRDQVIRQAEREIRELAAERKADPIARVAVLKIPGEDDRILTDEELAAVRQALTAKPAPADPRLRP